MAREPLRGPALRDELKRLLEAPVTELPAPEDGAYREQVLTNLKRGRQAQGTGMAVDFRTPKGRPPQPRPTAGKWGRGRT